MTFEHEIDESTIKIIELEILLSFDKLCKDNGLTYYLAYGTLLGAVRHKGFIPWDDDIDVWMLRKDYDKLNSLFGNKLIENRYMLKNMESPQYIYAFAKYIDTNTHVDEYWMLSNVLGVYIDVFPLDVVPREEMQFKKYTKKLMLFHYASLLTTRKNKKRHSKVLTFFSKMAYYPMRIIGYKKWLGRVDSLCKKYRDKETGYIGNMSIDTYIHKEHYPASWFESGEELEFENHLFSVPANYDAVLKQIYNNYMTLPPEEKRVKKHESKAYWIQSKN